MIQSYPSPGFLPCYDGGVAFILPILFQSGWQAMREFRIDSKSCRKLQASPKILRVSHYFFAIFLRCSALLSPCLAGYLTA